MDRMSIREVNGSYVTPEQVKEELPNFVARIQKFVASYYRAQFPSLNCPTITLGGGRKYIKIVSRGGDAPVLNSQRRVYCFVRAEDGAILKARDWKRPAKNFIRGSIFDDSLPLSPHGIKY